MRSLIAITLMGVLLLAACSSSMPGGAPLVSLSATSISFGQQMIGTTANAQPVILTNTGLATLQIAGITVDSGFQVTSTCGVSVTPNAKCEIDVAFSPAAAGDLSGKVTVKDNAAGSPHTIQLSGSGGVNAPRCLPKGMECPPSWPPCCAGLQCVPASTRAFCE